MKPVIGIHGLQGSGKTYLFNQLTEALLTDQDFKLINIKGTFAPVVDAARKAYEDMGYQLETPAFKQLQLRLSTFGEQFLSENIWTDRFVHDVSQYEGWAIADDIRTQYNIDGLREIAKGRPVVLFALDVPEAIRRARLGAAFRENGSYTEKLLERPFNLPKNFRWVTLDENWTLNQINYTLKDLYE